MTSSTSDFKAPLHRLKSIRGRNTIPPGQTGWRAAIIYLIIVSFLALISAPASFSESEIKFSFDELSKNEAFLVSGHTYRRIYQAKVDHVLKHPRFDVVSIGNHLLGGFTVENHWKDQTSFNLNTFNSPTNVLLFLVRLLADQNKLPKKLLLVTMLPHYPVINGISDVLPIKSYLDDRLPGSNFERYVKIGLLSSRDIISHLSYSSLLRTLTNGSAVRKFNSDQCIAKDRIAGEEHTLIDRFRLKASQYLPLEFLLATKVVDIDLLCREKTMIRTVIDHALHSDGSHPYTVDFPDVLHKPYSLPVTDLATIEREAREAASRLREIASIGEHHGVKVAFLVPPRYEMPLDGPNDRVVNQAFTMAPELLIIDHRRLSMDTSLYIDGSHPNQSYFKRYLLPCLKSVLNDEELHRFPAVGEAGHTIC